MTVVDTKTADYATLIDDIDATLAAAGWADSDGDVDNSGTDGTPENNGTVRQHPGTGVHLFFYLRDTNNIPAGIRCLISEGWNAAETRPSGKSNYFGNTDSVDNADLDTFANSFPNRSTNGQHSKLGVWPLEGDDTSVERTDACTYFLSATADHVAIGGIDAHDAQFGGSGWLLFEHIDNKFWVDDWANWAAFSKQHRVDSADIRAVSMYGWNTYDHNGGNNDNEGIHPGPGFDDGDYGIINPRADDNTFFHLRPVIYNTDSEETPVAYVEDLAYLNEDNGLNQDEEVTLDGTVYRAFRAKGEAEAGHWLSILLRHE